MTERSVSLGRQLTEIQTKFHLTCTLRKLVYFLLDKEMKFWYLIWKFWVFFLI
jgi:hypothetical protein